MVENFANAHSLILLAAGIDRYLSLFENCYSTYVARPTLFCFCTTIPYLLALILFDNEILAALNFTPNVSKFIRLSVWIGPTLLAVVFTACSATLVRPMRSGLRRKYTKSRSPNSRSGERSRFGQRKGKDIAEWRHSFALLAILVLDTIAKVGILLELLQVSFLYNIVLISGTSSFDWNRLLNAGLFRYYQVRRIASLRDNLISDHT